MWYIYIYTHIYKSKVWYKWILSQFHIYMIIFIYKIKLETELKSIANLETEFKSIFGLATNSNFVSNIL